MHYTYLSSTIAVTFLPVLSFHYYDGTYVFNFLVATFCNYYANLSPVLINLEPTTQYLAKFNYRRGFYLSILYLLTFFFYIFHTLFINFC
jgi:hypothetical protein